ncbi:hypothetical protein PPL19_12383 [Pseudomonas psychrotolerans L19]|nr:zinc-binding dehydrogenase [Pseudomonas psychrotolerans]EHK70794.1 hypothetical protein PPL19_12383 [Pseudomonas psychrotolerans L19]
MTAIEVHSVLDQTFPFADYLAAYQRLKSGNHVGKIVIDIAN